MAKIRCCVTGKGAHKSVSDSYTQKSGFLLLFGNSYNEPIKVHVLTECMFFFRRNVW